MNFAFKIKKLFYSANKTNILEDISINIEDSPLTIITGNNGVGKTTLMKILYGLYTPTSGRVERSEKSDIRKAFVFQNPVFLNNTVYNNFYHALYCKSIEAKYRSNIIDNIVSAYNLDYLLQKKIHALSGGEIQLVSLLRSLILDPQVLYYDEPSNNLDDEHIDMIMKIISNLIVSNKKIYMITHDARIKNNINHRNIHLYSNSEIHYEN